MFCFKMKNNIYFQISIHFKKTVNITTINFSGLQNLVLEKKTISAYNTMVSIKGKNY